MTGTPQPLVSLVVPLFNEQEGVAGFHNERLAPALDARPERFEIVYVNDGSADATAQVVASLAEADPRVKLVSLSRNFGKEIALTAGLAHVQGQATILLDGDGQHPPELIGEFLDRWHQGAQVVVGVRETNEKAGLVKNLGSVMFHRLFSMLTKSASGPGSTDFRLLDDVVRREFLRFSERNRISRGLVDWLGFRREEVRFHAGERGAGEPTYKFSSLVALAFNTFVSMSLRPLFALLWVGSMITVLAFVMGVIVGVEQLVLDDPLNWDFTGSAMLGILVTFLVGLVLVFEGVIALYLSHIHVQVQGRPIFVVDPVTSRNLDSASPGGR